MMFFVSEESKELYCDSELFPSFTQIPTKNIEGQMTPYYPVEMGNGTPCSLRQNRPRSSTVMYVCHPEAKHEILSVAEVTTCEYEVVILTPLLCSHPKYRYGTHIWASSITSNCHPSPCVSVFIQVTHPAVVSGTGTGGKYHFLFNRQVSSPVVLEEHGR